MATYVLTDCKLFLGGYAVASDFNNFTLNHEADAVENTAFGGPRTFTSGLKRSMLEGTGFFQAGVGKIDEILSVEFALNGEVVTVGPTDGAAGSPGFSFQSLVAKYNPLTGGVGDMLEFSLSAEGVGPLARGTIMENGAQAATGNGTARNLGAASATQKLYTALHVLSGSGTLTVKVQSDDASGFLTPADQITFTAATGIGAQWATAVSGPITDTWWRASWTIVGGPFTFLVLIAIQ